jgi:hypothetical protein
MIVVRYVFQAKWGKAGEVVEQFKKGEEMIREIAGENIRIRLLTDLSGPFDTIVQEIEVESFTKWEEFRAKLFSDPEYQKLQAEGEFPYKSGRAEFYTLEATF